jgi:hypothetical protein
MRFNDTPGAEKLFLVVSREPQQSLEQLIFSVQSGNSKGEPVPVRQNQPGAMLAMSRAINDPLISQMRRTYTRDLVLEAVNDRSPLATPENAVYVVNTSARPDSTVVADIQLTHQ